MFPSLPFATMDEFSLFTLVLGRVGGILAAIPLFGGKGVPARIKAGLVLVMSLVLYPVLRIKVSLPSDTVSLVVLIVSETLIGLSLGLLSQMIFTAVEFCGQMVGMQMGLSIANMFDPTQGQQLSIMSVFQNLLAMLLFMSIGAHHIFIRAIVDSYHTIPVGGWHVSGPLLQFLTATVANVFVLGIKLAAPVMVSLLATTVVLGIMARSFPQMNVFMISMPLNIGMAFLILGMSLMVFLHTLQNAFTGVDKQIKVLFRLLA